MLRKQVEQYLAETDWDKWATESEIAETTEDETHNANRNIARKMKLKGYSATDIADNTGLSLAEIKKL